MASLLSSGLLSGINPIIAEIPCGIVLDGITIIFLSSTRLSAC